MPIDPVDRELLNRYLSGETGPEESARVEAWLAEEPERWASLADWRQELEEEALSDDAVEQAKAQVWARLAREVRPVGNTPELRRRRRGRVRELVPASRRPWLARPWSAAAAVMLIAGAAGLATLLLRHLTPAETVMRVARTAAGERTVFQLPDGSRVMLSVASTIRYSAEFAHGPRDVTLEGEGYFQVVNDRRRPFTVRAGDLVARDLGTQFTVRLYPEDDGARVVVREGAVAIHAASGGLEATVAPGQLGRLYASSQPVVEPADTTAWFGWTEGRLVFEAVPLRQALPQLSRWFDLEFRLADSTLGGIPLTATLRSLPTDEVLNSLSAALGLKQHRAGRVVTFYSARSSR